MNRDDVLNVAPPAPGKVERALITATRVAAVPFLLVAIALLATFYAAAWLAWPLGRAWALAASLLRRTGRAADPH